MINTDDIKLRCYRSIKAFINKHGNNPEEGNALTVFIEDGIIPLIERELDQALTEQQEQHLQAIKVLAQASHMMLDDQHAQFKKILDEVIGERELIDINTPTDQLTDIQKMGDIKAGTRNKLKDEQRERAEKLLQEMEK